jgi:hypothetical protein
MGVSQYRLANEAFFPFGDSLRCQMIDDTLVLLRHALNSAPNSLLNDCMRSM